jgi:hypothetical protein
LLIELRSEQNADDTTDSVKYVATGTMSGTADFVDEWPSPADRDNSAWTEAQLLAFARLQLDILERVTRAELERLDKPPTGDQAARRRELRRRARIERLPAYLRSCLHQIELTRQALAANPQSARAVYHALMTGVLSQYPHAADVHGLELTHREAANETNSRKKARPKIKVAGR